MSLHNPHHISISSLTSTSSADLILSSSQFQGSKVVPKMKDAIVLYPAPGIGHLLSMVELGKLILSRYNCEFSIIILLTTGPFDTPATTSHIDRISQTTSSISFHRFPYLPFTASPTLGRLANMFEFLSLNDSNVLQSLQQLSEASSIRAVILDSFCTSAFPLARGLGIPTYFFTSFSAAALAAILYLPTIHKQTTKSFKDLPTTVFHIPGLPPLLATHMIEPLLDRKDPTYHQSLQFSLDLRKCDGVLTNTFDGLEPIALMAITNGECVTDGPSPSVYCIGPLIADSGEDAPTHKHDCLSRLDQQPSRSVVFLCFGSRGSFSREQVKEIANGLERSGQRFLWVVKIPPVDNKSKEIKQENLVWNDFDLDELMPEGFLERTKNRGMVVKSWAPQVAVLRHQSVGGFVSHVGWNSVLEAVVAGVPMVAWPLHAEQHLNKAVLVENMKMAIGVEQRDGDRFVSGAELERRLKELMDSEEGRELRERSEKMREMAVEAWREEGSSTTALAKLAENWKHD
ncbi:UDP-glycosyltransferase 88F3 [Vitis vinifera]|uniref:UDP-glycosyltransferase 88F3 n=1 Tax=Vitis vinifera TaxID=29760 RepID=A0A438IDX9_VITVI|nr:UDP-glycosyltransferase 88F3 [Vitis vinifera]